MTFVPRRIAARNVVRRQSSRREPPEWVGVYHFMRTNRNRIYYPGTTMSRRQIDVPLMREALRCPRARGWPDRHRFDISFLLGCFPTHTASLQSCAEGF